MVETIPIVAVHSTENYSLDLSMKVERREALLFYSSRPLQNRQEDVSREEFPGEFYVPPEKAYRLYLHLKLTIPGDTPEKIVALLGLEKKNPEEVFAMEVRRREDETREKHREGGFSYTPRPRHSTEYENWRAVSEAYMNLPGSRHLFTGKELADYNMIRARRLEEDMKRETWDMTDLEREDGLMG